MHSLAERWGQLGDEERTCAVPALLNSSRLPQERIGNRGLTSSTTGRAIWSTRDRLREAQLHFAAR
eukprot:2819547-Pyramimonas_sp.AAC.1